MNLVLAITGASGAIYPKIFIDEIKRHKNINLSVVASDHALRIFKEELNLDLNNHADSLYSRKNFDVPFVSGSAKVDAMVILPCSMGTLGRIAHGISDDSITRAADVFLKERRKLIICPRETPLSAIHLENMLKLNNAGAIIMPAMPSFYHQPKTLEDAAGTVVGRVFDHIGLEHDLNTRWAQ